MKIINPDFVAAVQPEDKQPAYIKHKAAVLAAIKADAAKESLSFDDVRKALSKTAEQLPDGHIHQICQDAGILVKPE